MDERPVAIQAMARTLEAKSDWPPETSIYFSLDLGRWREAMEYIQRLEAELRGERESLEAADKHIRWLREQLNAELGD